MTVEFDAIASFKDMFAEAFEELPDGIFESLMLAGVITKQGPNSQYKFKWSLLPLLVFQSPLSRSRKHILRLLHYPRAARWEWVQVSESIDSTTWREVGHRRPKQT